MHVSLVKALEAKPRFRHDCSTCIYVGQDEKHDFYICRGDAWWDDKTPNPTLIARYGPQGHEYLSTWVSLIREMTRVGWNKLSGKYVPPTSPEVQNYPLVKALKKVDEIGINICIEEIRTRP